MTHAGQVPAPGLLEVAQTWWDVERDPVVRYDAAGRTFWLADPIDPSSRLHLLALAEPSDDPAGLAATLAEGLAACDFPPTQAHAATGRVAATLRAAHRPERPA